MTKLELVIIICLLFLIGCTQPAQYIGGFTLVYNSAEKTYDGTLKFSDSQGNCVKEKGNAHIEILDSAGKEVYSDYVGVSDNSFEPVQEVFTGKICEIVRFKIPSDKIKSTLNYASGTATLYFTSSVSGARWNGLTTTVFGLPKAESYPATKVIEPTSEKENSLTVDELENMVSWSEPPFRSLS